MISTRTRITVLPGLAVAAFSSQMLATSSATAQATPVTGEFELLELRVEEDGVKGMPASIQAGRYMVRIAGPEPGETGPFGAIFAMLPEDVTAGEAYEEVMANPGELPSWYLETHWVGSVTLYQGTESWAIIDFTPGNWITTTVFATSLGVEFEVTGEMPDEPPVVDANVTIDLLEMTLRITDGALVAGDNVVTIHNVGAQVHFIDFSRLPAGTTKEQVAAMMDSFMTGTPPAEDELQEDDIIFVTVIGDVSPGVMHSAPVVLEPGTYFLSCWAPDPETFTPHAMMGMWDLITIE